MASRSLIAFAMQRYWRLTRALTLGAQGCILDADNRVLLIRHTYRPGWHFPGGGVEKNEIIEEALSRELREEAGIILDGKPELFAIYANFNFFPSDHVALFVVREWSQPVPPRPNHEIAEHGFFPHDALPEGITPPTRKRLFEVLNKDRPNAMW